MGSVDVVFVLDSSDSISNEDFTLVVENLADGILRRYPNGDSNLGMILFATDVIFNFYFAFSLFHSCDWSNFSLGSFDIGSHKTYGLKKIGVSIFNQNLISC
jgi:hypothetical protein